MITSKEAVQALASFAPAFLQMWWVIYVVDVIVVMRMDIYLSFEGLYRRLLICKEQKNNELLLLYFCFKLFYNCNIYRECFDTQKHPNTYS